MLTPILALIVWTLLIWVWLYATRIPAMKAAKITPAAAQDASVLKALPLPVRQIADNYNHLHEQPTLFYALAVYLHLAGPADGLSVALAWAYVASRVVHSLIQCTVNIVPARFAAFSLGTILLMVMAGRALLALATG